MTPDELRVALRGLSLKQTLRAWRECEAQSPDAVRYLCLADRYYLLVRVCRRSDALHPWLFERCREVEAAPDDYLDLWAREHYKSSIITFAGSIQEILRDPEITIGIFSHTRPIANKFKRQISFELEANTVLQAAFPDILYENPRSQSPRWNDDGIIVKRKGNQKESTVEAWGLVDGQPTASHFALRIYDDVVTRESVTTPDQVKKTTDAWELSDNLGTTPGRKWHVGTRYSYADTYEAMLTRGLLFPRLHPATDNGRVDGNPVLWDVATWEAKKLIQGPSNTACHVAGTTVLMADWTYKNIEDVRVGDEVVGFVVENRKTHLVPTLVVATRGRKSDAYLYRLESGKTVGCTKDHKWWTHRSGTDSHAPYCQLGALSKCDLKSLFRISNDQESDIDVARWQYLAGILDGEGTMSGGRKDAIVITQSGEHNPEVHARIEETLQALRLPYRKYERAAHLSHSKNSKASTLFTIKGGRHVRHKILLNAAPAKRRALIASLYCVVGGKASAERDRVVSREPLGETTVYNIQTLTGNYVANGYGSKNCQLLQNPLAGSQGFFDVGDLQTWEVRPRTLNIYILVDPARSMKKGSMHTAMAVIGIDAGRNRYLLDGYDHRMDLRTRFDRLWELYDRWRGRPGVQSIRVGYESYGAQADVDFFVEEGVRTGKVLPIEELKWPRDGEGSKDDRVQRLGPDIRSKRFYLPLATKVDTDIMAEMRKMEPSRVAAPIRKRDSENNIYDLSERFREQVRMYPFCVLKDLIDAVARLYDMDPVPPKQYAQEDLEPEAFHDS